MSWFDQISRWDDAPKGQEEWRLASRANGEKFAVAVLQRWSRNKLTELHPNSEDHANYLAMRINACQTGGLFRVMCGGDGWDNPCMSVLYTNSKITADMVIEICGPDMCEMVEI